MFLFFIFYFMKELNKECNKGSTGPRPAVPMHLDGANSTTNLSLSASFPLSMAVPALFFVSPTDPFFFRRRNLCCISSSSLPFVCVDPDMMFTGWSLGIHWLLGEEAAARLIPMVISLVLGCSSLFCSCWLLCCWRNGEIFTKLVVCIFLLWIISSVLLLI